MLNLIENNTDFKIALEASGKTISDINAIDPEWVKKLSRLINSKNCEFIGSGYCQIISLRSQRNYRKKSQLGNEIYSKLLKIKLFGLVVNRFSKSMIKIYKIFQSDFLDWIIQKNLRFL